MLVTAYAAPAGTKPISRDHSLRVLPMAASHAGSNYTINPETHAASVGVRHSGDT
jgi:hypothetical protein